MVKFANFVLKGVNASVRERTIAQVLMRVFLNVPAKDLECMGMRRLLWES